MDKEKALKIIEVAKGLTKLQEEFKALTGATFTVSQNLLDLVNYAQGFLSALKTNKEQPK